MSIVYIFLCLLRGRREIVVQITTEIEILFGSFRDHLACLSDVVGDRLFDEDMLPLIESLHRRFIVPTTILITASTDINDIQIGFTVNHIG